MKRNNGSSIASLLTCYFMVAVLLSLFSVYAKAYDMGYVGQATTISVGSQHMAAIAKEGTLFTWGYGYYGQLGNGMTNDLYKPQEAFYSDVSSVSSGVNYTAAVTTYGSLYISGTHIGQPSKRSYLVRFTKIMDNVSM